MLQQLQETHTEFQEDMKVFVSLKHILISLKKKKKWKERREKRKEKKRRRRQKPSQAVDELLNTALVIYHTKA